MEPASLLLAITTAVSARLKEKATGAAADNLAEAAKYQAEQLAGFFGDRKPKDFAEEVVRHVLAESAAFPPDRAVRVVPLVEPEGTGIYPPDSRLVLELLWINRADFPVRVRNVDVTGRVGSDAHEYAAKVGDEITLPARGEYRQQITLPVRLGIAVPVFDAGRANCDVKVEALVTGPWPDEPQKTRLVHDGATMVPVFVEPQNMITDPVDIKLVLDSWFASRQAGDVHYRPETIQLADVERLLKIPAGSARSLIVAIADKRKFDATLGNAIVQVTRRPDPPRQPTRVERW